MGKDNKRAKELLDKTVEEYKKDLEIIDSKFKALDKKIHKLTPLILIKMKQACLKAYEWMENNYTKENDGSIVLRKGLPKEEVEEKTKELIKCSDENDSGFKLFFEKINKEQENSTNKSSNCFNSCVDKSKEYNDEDLKRCYKTCFTTSIQDMNDIAKAMEDKIKEFHDNYRF